MRTIWDNNLCSAREMTAEEEAEYYRGNYAPIDPMWQKAATWSSMSSKPVTVKLNTMYNEFYYVVSASRVWTHRTFFTLAGQAAWNIHPTPTIVRALYNEALMHHTVGQAYDPINDMKHDNLHRMWYGQCQRELFYNCDNWLQSITDQELLQFLDIKNYKFNDTHTYYRSDDYRNNGGVAVDLSGNKCIATEINPFEVTQ